MQPLPCARQAAGAAPAQLIPSFGVFDSHLTPHPQPLSRKGRGDGAARYGSGNNQPSLQRGTNPLPLRERVAAKQPGEGGNIYEDRRGRSLQGRR